VEIWSQGTFGLGESTLASLVGALARFDFAILIVTADDATTVRGETRAAPRDNVLFELGLFMGALGPTRTFMVTDRSNPPKLPSDLAGVTPAEYEPHTSGNLEAALGAPSTKIREAIARLGFR
jgi:predicted nucleotide-binding protein